MKPPLRLALAAMLVAGTAAAQSPGTWRLVTTSPAADGEPAISRDGKWLVFSSDRDGAPGLFAQRLGESRPVPPRPVAPHPAKSHSPRFSPADNTLAFVSHRDDALGSIYTLSFPGGETRAISPMATIDRSPFFTESGTLLYERAAADGTVRWLDASGGEAALPHPERRAAIPHPAHSIDPSGDFALLFSDDTNRDGRLGDSDAPSIWAWTGDRWAQQTFPMPGATAAARHPKTGRYFVAAQWRSSLDIAEILSLPLDAARTAAELAALGDEAMLEEVPRFDEAVCYYRAALARSEPAARGALWRDLAWALGRGDRFMESARAAEAAFSEGVSDADRRRIMVEKLRADFQLRQGRARGTNAATLPQRDLGAELRALRAEFLQNSLWDDAGECEIILVKVELASRNFDAAIDWTTQLLDRAESRRNGILRCRAWMNRADVYAQMGLGAEVENSLLAVFREGTRNNEIESKTAQWIVDVRRARGTTGESILLELKNLASAGAEWPQLEAAARLAEGRQLAALGRTAEARSAWKAAAALAPAAPGPGATAAREVAANLMQSREFSAAIAELKSAEAAIAQLDRRSFLSTAQALRADLVAAYLEKGRQELRLGDNLLAAATFSELLAIDPALVEGWRGRIRAISGRADLLAEAIRDFEAEAAAEPGNALAWYKLGLARSYPESTSTRTRKALERAIALDPAVPFFHLTLGFVLEEQFRLHKERGSIRKELLELAANHNEQVLGLLDEARDRQLLADALLNSANVALALQQFSRADDLYRRRESQPAGFDDARTELLFRWNSGIAAFRANDPRRAAGAFDLAVAALAPLEANGTLDAKTVADIELELAGRRALALMEGGRNAEARAGFADVFSRSPERSLARVRALRNQALLLERECRALSGEPRIRALAEARALAERALSELADPKLLGDPDYSRGGAMVEMDVVFAANQAEGAPKLGFDRDDEQRLLEATLGRIAELQGDREASLAALRRQLALDPKVTDANRSYVFSARSVALHRMAAEAAARGDDAEAMRLLAEGLSLSRYMIAADTFANANAASLMLASMAEILARNPSVAMPRDPAAMWMAEPSRLAGGDGWELLDHAAQRLLAMDDPSSKMRAVPLVAAPRTEARLRMVLARCAEQRIASALAGPAPAGTALVERSARIVATAAQLDAAAERVLALAAESPQTEELYRLGAHAYAAQIRSAAMLGNAERAASLEVFAQEYLRQTGQPQLAWWFAAQPAIALGDGPEAEAAADRALAMLAQPIGPAPDWDLPWNAFDELEAISLRRAVASGSAAAAWDAVERWRVARLAWLAAASDPVPAGDADAQWLAQWNAAAQEMAVAMRALRGLPPGPTQERARRMAAMDAASGRLAELAERGNAEGLPSAAFKAPAAVPFEALAELFGSPELLPQSPVFLLSRNVAGTSVRAVFTPEGEKLLPAGEAFPASPSPFVLGDAAGLPGEIRILCGRSFFGKFQRLALRAETPAVSFASLAPGAWRRDAFLAPHLALGAIAPTGAPAELWPVAPGIMLKDVLAAAPNLDRLDVAFAQDTALAMRQDAPRSITALAGESRTLALAALLDQRGIAQASIGGQRWLGWTVDPRNAPELAESEIAVANGELVAAIERLDKPGIAPPLQKIILLEEALGKKEDLRVHYERLTEAWLDLDRAADAAEAAKRRVELARELAEDGPDLARVLVREGDALSRARRWAACFAAYTEAVALYRAAGDQPREADAIGRLAVALENSGDYPAAIARAREARALVAADAAAALALDVRIARILRVYLNRYDEAEALLLAVQSAADRDGLAALAREARLNRVRIYWNTARFDEADALAAEVEAAAAEDADYRAQALLERANVAWVRADYFASFRAQQQALEIAETGKLAAVEIAVRNISGLTSWAVNDLDRARGELKAALALAQRERVDAEVASTANNLGLVERSARQWDAALAWFAQALEIDRTQGNRWGEAYALRNIGITHTQSGRHADAVAPLERAVALADEIGDRVNGTKARLALADAHASLGAAALATPLYREALDRASAIPLPEMKWRALFGLAKLEIAAGDPAGIVHLSDAAETIDGMRASIRLEEFQDGFLADKQEVYDLLVKALADAGRPREALEASERSRGRNFIDLLGNRRVALARDEDEAARSRERVLRSAVEAAERKVSANQAGAAAELESARRAYSDFHLALRASNPAVAAFLRVEPIRADELQALAEPDTRIVVYHILPSELFAWVIAQDRIDLVRVPVGAGELSRAVLDARLRMQSFDAVDADFAKLASWLVDPILPYASGASRLCIVPHRELHTLPFAPLPAGPAELLIDRAALFYAPSASVLRYTQSRRGAKPAEPKVLAIGNPDLADAAFDLPFAQKEAERLPLDFQDVTIRVRGDATETWLAANLQDYAIVHIAGHGEYKPEEPLLSAVLLAKDAENDGQLSAQEVFGLEVRADLIALSACQSGLGRIGSGDDIVGLNRAFVYAGTRQLLTTLWRVDDISTAVLFKHFYRNIKSADRAEALREAQRQLKSRPEYRHPAHWAGLVLSGDWQ